jgi:hypothetical protein
VNRVFRAPVIENVMATMGALRNALSYFYAHLFVALLAVESASFIDFFTRENRHIDLLLNLPVTNTEAKPTRPQTDSHAHPSDRPEMNARL